MNNEEGNLRGKRVWFNLDGRVLEGTVITHIRNGRWMIQSSRLPRSYARPWWQIAWSVRRIILPRDQFVLEKP